MTVHSTDLASFAIHGGTDRRVWRRLVSRREALRVGCLGAFGVSLTQLLQRPARAAGGSAGSEPSSGGGRAKSCIVLFCWGGMSQLESWDPRPEAPKEVRGDYQAISTATPGVQIGEYLPRLARQTGRLAIVRSCRHRARDHRQAAFWTLTGVPPIQLDGVMVSNPVLPTREDKPCLGSMVAYVRSQRAAAADGTQEGASHAELPGTVTLPYPVAERGLIGGQDAGFLGVRHDPLVARPKAGLAYPGVSPVSDAPDFDTIDEAGFARLRSRRQLLQQLEREKGDGTDGTHLPGTARGVLHTNESRPLFHAPTWSHFHDHALDMLTSPRVKHAFSLEQEPPRLHAAYGQHIFGQSVLLARRLTEAGVPLVTVNCGAGDLNGGIGAIWDTHFHGLPQLKNFLMPPFDQAASALLDDLAERNTLDETLVVFLTEFGRQPLINQAAGRDHLPDCYSVAFAGGGIRGGQVHGRSDRFAAEVEDGACGPPDLHATVFHALGIDFHATLSGPGGEAVPLAEGVPLPLFG